MVQELSQFEFYSFNCSKFREEIFCNRYYRSYCPYLLKRKIIYYFFQQIFSRYWNKKNKEYRIPSTKYRVTKLMIPRVNRSQKCRIQYFFLQLFIFDKIRFEQANEFSKNKPSNENSSFYILNLFFSLVLYRNFQHHRLKSSLNQSLFRLFKNLVKINSQLFVSRFNEINL